MLASEIIEQLFAPFSGLQNSTSNLF